MHTADIVAREAKQAGRNLALGADEDTLRKIRARGAFITIEEVKQALRIGELRHYVQPIWNAAENKVEGFEALIRWVKPDGTVVMPDLFIRILREVIRDPKYKALKAGLWKNAIAGLGDFPDCYVSFNFTLEQLAFKGAADTLIQTLREIMDHPDRKLVIELYESALTDLVDQSVLIDELNQLHDAGFVIALDDFGTASSNLNRLLDYPIDTVKFDKALLDEVTENPAQRTVLEGIAGTMQNLGLIVIAEGVETQKKSDLLTSFNIPLQQGYLHARPMPVDQLGEWIDTKSGIQNEKVVRVSTERRKRVR